jgi:hypothetical protein
MIERSIGNREVLMLSEQQMAQIHGMECYDESYAAAYMAAMASRYPAILEAYTAEEDDRPFHEYAAAQGVTAAAMGEPIDRLEGLSPEEVQQYSAWAHARAIAFIEELGKA